MVGLIMDGVGWEAVVKASLLVALLLLIGFSHQSSKKHAQQNSLVRLSDPRPAGGGLARAGIGGMYELADVQTSTRCSVLLRDKTLKQTCPSLALSCEQQFTESRATAEVSNLINDIGTQAPMLPSRPSDDSCTDSVSTNSFTIQIDSPASTCS
jgi:hypothetical protein